MPEILEPKSGKREAIDRSDEQSFGDVIFLASITVFGTILIAINLFGIAKELF